MTDTGNLMPDYGMLKQILARLARLQRQLARPGAPVSDSWIVRVVPRGLDRGARGELS